MTIDVRSALVSGAYCPRLVREWVHEDGSSDLLHRRIDGSMVFADVSGFTRMSERLARFGKVGAEAVTEVISTCFTRLLDEAYAYGGTLLQFGGDALLLFYRGPDHAPRAAAAALEMRRTLWSLRGLPTQAGKVALSMTVGVHSGGFDFFLVGASHRQLVVGGAVASELVELEGSADKGRILMGDATAAALDRSNLGPERGPGRLLRGVIDVPRGSGVEFLNVTSDMSDFVAVGLRRAVATDAVQSEHRTATVAFVDFAGLDRSIAAEGPEVAARRLDELMRGVQRSIDDRGICFQSADIGVDGGKFYLSVGAPLSTGHDEEQMLLALSEIVRLDVGFPIRAGVNCGPVFTGEIGTVHRRTYTTMGDTVNLAARVMSKAEVGHLYATRAVLDRSRTLFDTTPLAPFRVKGKSLPVVAFSVGPPSGVRAPVGGDDLPLVGREREVARFREAVAAAEAGAGQFIEIVAEPGAGKSRLLDQFVADAGTLQVHRVGCRLYQATAPYFVFELLFGELFGLDDLPHDEAVDRLSALVHAADPDLDQWLALIAVPFGLEVEPSPAVRALDEEFRREQLHTSLARFLVSVPTDPLLVCFEDAQWMDDASGELIEALGTELEHRPWVVVVTRRDVDTGFVPSERPTDARFVLEPLGAEALEALIDAATEGAPLAPHVKAALVERCDGNPLFLLELLAAVAAGGDLETLPTSVEGLVTARIDRLDAPDRALLRHLSVLGSGFRSAYVPSVMSAPRPDAVDDSLRRLDEFLTVDHTGWVSFRHALVRDTAYSGLPFRARRELHGRVADSMLDRLGDAVEDEAPLLSLHCAEAHRHLDAWRFSVLAGDRAREVFDNLDAATFYQRALQAARHLPDVRSDERVQVVEKLGDAQDLAGLWDDARRSFAEARRMLGHDPVGRAQLNLKTAWLEERRGRFTNAIRHVRRGQRLVDGVDGVEAQRVRAQLADCCAYVRINQGRLAEAADEAETGVVLARLAGDERTLAHAALAAEYAAASLGRSTGDEGSRGALEIYERLGDLRGEAVAANMLGVAAYFAGRWGEAADLYRRSRDARLRMGDIANAAVATANLAELLVEQGRLDEALVEVDDAQTVALTTGDAGGVAFARRLRGIACARLGDLDRAEELLTEARVGFHAIKARGEVVGTDVFVAELALLRGRRGEAATLLDEVLAADMAALGCDHLLPTAHRLRALTLDDESARGELERAVEVAREYEAEHEVALALHDLAELDRRVGRPVSPDQQAELSEIVGRLRMERRLAAPSVTA